MPENQTKFKPLRQGDLINRKQEKKNRAWTGMMNVVKKCKTVKWEKSEIDLQENIEGINKNLYQI